MSRPAKKKLLLSVFALALLSGGFAIVQSFVNDSADAQEAGGEMPAMPVPIVTAEEKPLQIWKEFSARLAAVDYVEIRPQVSGLIEEVHFTDGQEVNQGDILYTIDQRPYAAAVAEAKAQVAAANDTNAYAQQELKRAQELMKTGALSKQVFEQRTSEARVARSSINGANARVKSAQVALDNSSIKAPISGRVSRTEITEGNLVKSENAPLLTTIVSDKDIYADFEVDEQTYLKYIRQKSSQSVETEQGIPVKMKMANDDKWYNGKIKSFDNKIDPSSGTIRARAIFTNDDGALLPGMFTRVQLGSASEENRIAIPEKAIGTDQNRKFVYVIENGTATYREIKPGETSGTDRVILSGLKAGDQIIVEGLMKLRPGAKVQGMTPEQMQQMKAQAAAAQGGTPAAEAAPATPPEAPTEEASAPAEENPAAVEPAPQTAAEPTTEELQSAEDVPLIDLRATSQDAPIDLTIQPDQPQAQE